MSDKKGFRMHLNPISAVTTQTTVLPKIKYGQKTVMPEQKESVKENKSSLWGSGLWRGYTFDIDFGAARPSNNPKGFPAIEADTQSGFKLSTLQHSVCCPDCGKPVMTKPVFAEIKRELDEVGEENYINVLENHKEFLLPQEKKIFQHIKNVNSKHPEMSLREILSTERDRRYSKLEKLQYDVLDKIDAVGELLPYEDRSKVTGLMTTSSSIIFQREMNYAFQRSKFIELVDNLKLKDKNAKAEIRKLAEELPSSMDNEDAWYVKYSGVNTKKQPYTNRDIAEKLLSPAYTNTDHVHPWNRGGYDAVSNFWLMHARCNIVKNDKPFEEWLNEDKKNHTQYIKQYLKETQAAIDSSDDKKMQEKYGLYAAKLAKTIFYETNGEIDFTKEFPLPEGYDVPRPKDNKKKTA